VFNDYHFITHWRVRGTVKEIIDILSDAEDLPRWWPSVYIDVKKRGDIVELYTKGWLTYTLRWSFRVVETKPDADAIGRQCRHHLRLAHPRRKAATETLLPNPQTNLRRQPSLGHVPRRRKPQDRARAKTRRAARQTAEGDVPIETFSASPRCVSKDCVSRNVLFGRGILDQEARHGGFKHH
jgi:hypothetical protein